MLIPIHQTIELAPQHVFLSLSDHLWVDDKTLISLLKMVTWYLKNVLRCQVNGLVYGNKQFLN